MSINPWGRIIGIVGTRRRDTGADFTKVACAFWEHYKVGDWICSGGCPQGGDRFAKMLHHHSKLPYLEFPANWRPSGEYDPRAGFDRNTFIAQASDILIACVAEDREGGTEDTIAKFEAFHGGLRLLILV